MPKSGAQVSLANQVSQADRLRLYAGMRLLSVLG